MTLGDQLDGSPAPGRTTPPAGIPVAPADTAPYSVTPVNGPGRGAHGCGQDFDTFFSASFRRVAAALAPVVGNFAEAEDVAQEAFAVAASRWTQISAYEDPEGWVRRVAYNRAISSLRSAQRRTRAWLRQAEPAPSSRDEFVSLELFDAMRRLPLKYRTVLTLHYLVDLPVKQIAQELDLRFLTVRSHLVRGRRRLQELLADTDVHDDGRGDLR